MKNILIIYPHWPPSNLTGVHRPRLIANNLRSLGWHPIVLTVHEKYYEEELDHGLEKLVSPDVEVVKVKAVPVWKPRLIGDIGLRAMPYLVAKALELVRSRNIDFVWIPIPSFYTALLGRYLNFKTGIHYGIDYIDPWVRNIEGRRNFRSIISLLLARFLEPIAVKKASLISGVSKKYFQPVLDRNFGGKVISTVAMPYGFDPDDHRITLGNLDLPWLQDGKRAIVYAGALLPQSLQFLRAMFSAVRALLEQKLWPGDLKFYFVGIGKSNIKILEEEVTSFNLHEFVETIPERKPYLWVLNMLSQSSFNLILGSIEKHYSPSKIFQNLLSGKPLVCICHIESAAISFLHKMGADELTIRYDEGMEHSDLMDEFRKLFSTLISGRFSWRPDLSAISEYSAAESAKKLVVEMNRILLEK